MEIDAVVVLAHLMDANGNLSEESADRAAKAVQVLREHPGAMIVTSGWAYRDDSEICIADAFRRHIISRHSIAELRVVSETNSRDTVGDAYFTKVGFVDPRGWKSLAVVTSDYHVPRTQEIFSFVYGSNVAVSVVSVARPMPSAAAIENEKSSIRAFRKTFAGVRPGVARDIYQCLRNRHPYYNGEIYPQI